MFSSSSQLDGAVEFSQSTQSAKQLFDSNTSSCCTLIHLCPDAVILISWFHGFNAATDPLINQTADIFFLTQSLSAMRCTKLLYLTLCLLPAPCDSGVGKLFASLFYSRESFTGLTVATSNVSSWSQEAGLGQCVNVSGVSPAAFTCLAHIDVKFIFIIIFFFKGS